MFAIKRFFISFAILSTLGSVIYAQKCPAPVGGCSGSDCTIYDITSQSACSVVENGATSDARWKAGLNLNVDQRVLEGKIVAYKIQWSNGRWSDWFVPGVNDIDTKVNGYAMRRQWSNFYDHTHSYIICK